MSASAVSIIDFELRRHRGRVSVRYGSNDDPIPWGYPLLGLTPLVEVSRGFPVVQAEVEYDGEGYGAVLGWIQVVSTIDLESQGSECFVDRAPQLVGLDLPYMSFGVRPVLFDAPSTDSSHDMNWEAHAYLVVSPDCLMTRRVQPVCAFGWGYQLRDGEPHVADLTVLDASRWSTDQRVLRECHTSWDFQDWA